MITAGARRSSGQRTLAALGLAALTASAVFGGNPFGVRERLLGSATAPAVPAAVSRVAGGPPGGSVATATTVLRSQPWWQDVRTLSGTGPMTAPAFTIAARALQWRVTWTCQQGNLAVQATGDRHQLIGATCPGTGTGYATRPGATSLQVHADGPWQLRVEQQVDVPLDEPPLAAMTAPGAAVASTGSFYRIDQVGTGRVSIYRLPDGSFALRLAGFYVTPNTDLEVRLSPLPAPHSTEEFTAAPSARVSSLDVTAGFLNFAVPKGIEPTHYRSVVLWCERLHSAYVAASLAPA